MINRIKAFLKGVSYEEYLRSEFQRLKRQVATLPDYNPNLLTFLRDAWGFGKYKISLFYYSLQALFCLALYLLYLFDVLHSLNLLYGVLLAIPINIVIGTTLRLLYPVSSSK